MRGLTRDKQLHYSFMMTRVQQAINGPSELINKLALGHYADRGTTGHVGQSHVLNTAKLS